MFRPLWQNRKGWYIKKNKNIDFMVQSTSLFSIKIKPNKFTKTLYTQSLMPILEMFCFFLTKFLVRATQKNVFVKRIELILSKSTKKANSIK